MARKKQVRTTCNLKSQIRSLQSVEIGAAQIEPALRALEFAAALAQLRRAIRTVLPRIGPIRSRPMSAIIRLFRFAR